jgi:hypothetical protein
MRGEAMREIKVGIRANVESGISFFGLDEANAALKEGAFVVSVEPGDALMVKLREDAENVRLALRGCSIRLIMSEGPQ